MSLTKSQSSRINGAKSKGPRTEEGKQRSSQNAIKHGCSAVKLTVLENEDSGIFDSIYNALCEKFQPQDDLERDLLLQAANARFRLRRVWQLETSLFDLKMLDERKWVNAQYKGLSEGDRQALAFQSLAEDGRALALAHRYEASLNRAYQRAIADLLTARKAQKSSVPNEPKPINGGENGPQNRDCSSLQREGAESQNEPKDSQLQNRDCSSLQRQGAVPQNPTPPKPVTQSSSTNLHLIDNKKEQQ